MRQNEVALSLGTIKKQLSCYQFVEIVPAKRDSALLVLNQFWMLGFSNDLSSMCWCSHGPCTIFIHSVFLTDSHLSLVMPGDSCKVVIWSDLLATLNTAALIDRL